MHHANRNYSTTVSAAMQTHREAMGPGYQAPLASDRLFQKAVSVPPLKPAEDKPLALLVFAFAFTAAVAKTCRRLAASTVRITHLGRHAPFNI